MFVFFINLFYLCEKIDTYGVNWYIYINFFKNIIMKKRLLIVSLMVAFMSSVLLYVDSKRMTSFVDSNVNALAESESGRYCYSGGPGSNSCSIAAGIEILGCGVTEGCSVSCNDGYYACCVLQCTCIEE